MNDFTPPKKIKNIVCAFSVSPELIVEVKKAMKKCGMTFSHFVQTSLKRSVDYINKQNV